jgi:predicted DNA-binding protein with PD1-like motif
MKFTIILLSFFFLQCKNSQPLKPTDTTSHVFRLKPGQDLRKEIEAFVQKENILAGWIITCVGSLTQTNLRFANQPGGSGSNGHFEIVSLTGTISTSGSHLHMSVSDSLGRTIGGHLLDGNIVYTTAEIVIGESKSLVFSREKDGTTAWEELQVKKK